MRRIDRVFSAVLLVLGIAYLFESAKLPLWKGTTLGPGLFPILLGIAMVAIAGTLLAATLFRPAAVEPAPSGSPFLPPRAAMGRQAWLLGTSAAYFLTLETLGFIISTFVFVAVLAIALEPARKISALLVAAFLVAASYAFLVTLLKMPLPSGLLG